MLLRSKQDISELRESYRSDVKKEICESSITLLAAKLAIVDSDINISELKAFAENFPINDKLGIRKEALMIEASHTNMDFRDSVTQITKIFPDKRVLFRGISALLFDLAIADGALNTEEITFLQEVLNTFGITEGFFTNMLRKCIMPPSSGNPYEILSVSKKISPSELKKAYRSAMSLYHPDRFASSESTDEIIMLINARINVITIAYNNIKAMKKFY